MSISKLKRSRTEDITKLTQRIQDDNKGGVDDRFWKPFLDKEKGTGFAKIRFLPHPANESDDYVRVYDHGIKGPSGKYYIENSLTTPRPGFPKGEADPVTEMNSRLWNSGVEDDKKLASEWKRRLNYYSNIYVVEDPAKPENNGKVFLFRYGPAIFKMIQDKIKPQFQGDTPANPFNLWGPDSDVPLGGATFILKARAKKTGEVTYWDYDLSTWELGELFPGDDQQKDAVWSKCHSLSAFIAPDKFKSYTVLQQQLYEVLGPYVGSGIEVWPGKDGVTPAPATPTPASKLAAAKAELATVVENVSKPAAAPAQPASAVVEKAQVSALAAVSAPSAQSESDEFLKFFETIKRS